MTAAVPALGVAVDVGPENPWQRNCRVLETYAMICYVMFRKKNESGE